MGLETSLRNVIQVAVHNEVRTAVREEMRAQAPAPSPPAGNHRYLSVAEAARMAGVRPPTVRSWIDRGHLPGHRAGRLFRVRLDQLEEFLANGPVDKQNRIDLDQRAEQIVLRRATR